MRKFQRRGLRKRRSNSFHERKPARPASISRTDRSSQISLISKSPRTSRPASKTSSTKRPPSSMASITTPPFLRLPSEIRITIFRYVLPPQDPSRKFKVYTDCDSTYTDRKWSVQRLIPDPLASTAKANTLAILRTNRLIYFEALSVLYSENAFHFVGSNFLPILDFIRRLSPEAKSLVRQLKVTMLPENPHVKSDQVELFCRVVHDWLPGLNVLDSDSWVWF